MIQSFEEYFKDVMERGTPEAKVLLEMEVLFAGTMARKVAGHVNQGEKFREELHLELIALLISHRGPVLANYLMERARGLPMPAGWAGGGGAEIGLRNKTPAALRPRAKQTE